MTESDERQGRELQHEWDTDSFEGSRFDGLQRDKHGELAILLPDSERTLARLRGFPLRLAAGGEKAGHLPEEKGSSFAGTLSDERGVVDISQAALEEPAAGKPEQEAPPPSGVDYGQTEIVIPHRPQKDTGPTVGDFDLDFTPSTRRPPPPPQQERQPRPRDEQAEERRMMKTRPGWMPPDEKQPVAPPAARAAEPRKQIPFEEPDFPDSAQGQVIVRRERRRRHTEAEDEPAAATPRIEARSYLDDEPVIAGPSAAAQRPRTKRKMKLPKSVKEKKTSLLMVLVMILLLLVLAVVLVVQYVPEARAYYDKTMGQIFGKERRLARRSPATSQEEEEGFFITVGQSRVHLKEGTDVEAVRTYTSETGKAFAGGIKAISGKKK